MIDRAYFFDGIRDRLAGGHLTQTQVNGLEFLLIKLDVWNFDPRWAAYMLATVWHETGGEMQPNAEKGSPSYFAKKKYGFQWRGRGYVHLTWRENYEKFGKVMLADLLGDPERALEPDMAWEIMRIGMVKGLFTGRRLDQYFNDEITRWSAARAIINGTDCADKIAGYANIFFDSIREG